MLTIKRRHNAIKAITAGSVAFAIGLTGATAFIGDNFQAETPTFNKEQNTANAKNDPIPVSDGTSDTAKTGNGNTGNSDAAASGTATQPAGSSTFAPAPTTGTTSTSSPTQSLTQSTGGTGGTGGTTNTDTTSSQTDTTNDTGSLTDPVTNLVQDTCVTSCLLP